MDPNANLKRQLEIARLLTGEDTTHDAVEDDVKELGELVCALDEWIRKGGFLPEAWQSAKRRNLVAKLLRRAREEERKSIIDSLRPDYPDAVRAIQRRTS